MKKANKTNVQTIVNKWSVKWHHSSTTAGAETKFHFVYNAAKNIAIIFNVNET